MADTVWATGLWPDGFWATGLWSEGEAAPDTPAETGGGWAAFLNDYELERNRKRRRKREQDEAEEATQTLQPVDREIAQFLHKQEREDERRKDLDRLKELATRYADEKAEAAISKRLADAFERARARQTISSLKNLERELRRMLEEEEMAVLMLMINADD